MAPPRQRRPGYSRRAQYGIFFGYLGAAFGGLAGLALVGIAMVDPQGFAVLRTAAAEVTAPLGHGFAMLRSGGRSLGREAAAWWNAGAQNAELRREVEQTRVKLVEAEALAQENRRLKRLLGVIDREGQPVAVARLIGSTAASTRRIATLGAGSRDGVRVAQPVRSQEGLVGRILEVGPNTARVLLVTDPDNVVPVRRARDDVAAFSEGRSDGTVTIRLINVGINPLKPGDIMVTSGNGGLYRPNIPVARVERLTSDGAIARILSNPAATDFVLVQAVYRPDMRPAARPPAPLPAPAPAPATSPPPAGAAPQAADPGT